jgi:serine/threonine protein kinase
MRRNFDEIFKRFEDEEDVEYFGRSLGKGAYGEVRDVKMKNANKMLAAKLYIKKKSDLPGEVYYPERLRGPNIVKINKTIEQRINQETYELIIMEKALLRDLGKLSEFYHKHNLLKLIDKSAFYEELGNSLLRFYTRQIVHGLEALDRNYYVHFDIKPENLLVTINLEVKLSDFSLLTEVKEKDKLKIPGSTHGYESPEYYKKELISRENAKKQDYFALGATLYNLKYGKTMNGFKKSDDNEVNNIMAILSLQHNIYELYCSQVTEQDFINFVQNLINYVPEERLNFEQIYRNKWLNNNVDIIKKILIINESDEEKAITY